MGLTAGAMGLVRRVLGVPQRERSLILLVAPRAEGFLGLATVRLSLLAVLAPP
jgi:hypothetical protein